METRYDSQTVITISWKPNLTPSLVEAPAIRDAEGDNARTIPVPFFSARLFPGKENRKNAWK